jgi:hypothetical protein
MLAKGTTKRVIVANRLKVSFYKIAASVQEIMDIIRASHYRLQTTGRMESDK